MSSDANHGLLGAELLGIRMETGSAGWGEGEIQNPRGAEFVPAVWRTTDGGKTWLDVAPTPVDSISHGNAGATDAFVSSSVAWVAFNSDLRLVGKEPLAEIFRTTDGGKCWSATVLPKADVGYPLSLTAVNATTAYLTLYTNPAKFPRSSGTLLVTHDGGATWSQVASQPGGLPYPGTYTPAGGRRALLTFGALSGLQKIYGSADGGQGWQALQLAQPGCQGYQLDGFHTPVMFGSNGYLPVMTQAMHLPGEPVGGGVYATIDGGATWHWLSVPWCGPEIASFDSATDGWVWGWSHWNSGKPVRGHLFHTTDGVKTGTTVSPGATLDQVCCRAGNGLSQLDFISATQGWALANTSSTSNALLETEDGGRSWKVVWQDPAP